MEMKRLFKVLLVLVLLLVLLIDMMPDNAWAADTIDSGICGENLTWVLSSDGVLVIDGRGDMWDSAFTNCDEITSVVIGDEVTSIGNKAFFKCDNLDSVLLGDAVKSIGERAFFSCDSLTSVLLPSSLTSIGKSAFGECHYLVSIIIPNGVTSIGDLAFAETGLTSITIPESVINIGEDAFYACVYLQGIWVEENNPAYSSDSDGVLFNKDKTTLIQAPSDSDAIAGVYCVPDSITSIAENAFGTCFKLTSVIIPEGVLSIGNHTFAYCYGLTDIVIPDGVNSVGLSAFWDCESLVSVTIPDSVVEIGEKAFSGCKSLNDVYYSGSEDQWTSISVDERNDELLNANIHFNYMEPSAGNHESHLTGNAQSDPYTGENEPNGESDETGTTPSNTNAKIVVYSDHSNLSIRKENNITLSAAVLVNGEASPDVSGITFQIEDTSILKANNTRVKDNRVYVKMYGLKPGITNIVFSDSKTGCVVTVPITVFDNNYLFYTLDSVPTQHIEKYPTNFYNINGLYIDNYAYSIKDNGTAKVSFDVYNTNYSYAVVEAYDENGNMSDAAVIDKLTSNTTNFKEVLWDGTVFLIRDLIDGDFLTYRQETGFSKCTPIEVTIPKNGYIKIQTSPVNSFLTGFINGVDVLMTMNALANEVNDFDVNSYDFTKKITKKMVFDASYAQIIKDGDNLKQNLWKNITWETLVTSEAMGDFIETIARNIDELHLGKLIAQTAGEFGYSVGEEVVKHFMGPAGIALDAIFGLGKIENFVVQCADLADLCTAGAICIQNQGGGYRACQQVVVTGENSFAPDTSLSVFTVTIASETLDILKDSNPEIYESIMNGRSYTYNISLINDGEAIQPNGKVTVCIPIPENLRLLAGGEIANIIPADIVVYRVEDNGTMTAMDIKIENGCIVFTTDHFSLYTIVWDDTNGEKAISQIPWNYIILGVTVIGIGVIFFGFCRKKRGK